MFTNQSTIMNALEELGSDLSDLDEDDDWFQQPEEMELDLQKNTDTEDNALEPDLTDMASANVLTSSNIPKNRKDSPPISPIPTDTDPCLVSPSTSSAPTASCASYQLKKNIKPPTRKAKVVEPQRTWNKIVTKTNHLNSINPEANLEKTGSESTPIDCLSHLLEQ